MCWAGIGFRKSLIEQKSFKPGFLFLNPDLKLSIRLSLNTDPTWRLPSEVTTVWRCDLMSLFAATRSLHLGPFFQVNLG